MANLMFSKHIKSAAMRKFLTHFTALVVTLLTINQNIWAQQRVVTGTVTDAAGKAIPGVNVVVKGTSVATQTDANGVYRISAPVNSTLVFSSVGFGTMELNSGEQTTLDASMAASAGNLSEVVVIGYGTARRKDLTGSVASVRERDFNKGVMLAPDQLIQGKVAGLQILTNSGQPGAATTVRIRGISSIRSGSQPLYVLDGIPLPSNSSRPGLDIGFGSSPQTNPMNFINPNDIASMEVLRDASATAIYGSRGANGVIIINTKRGNTGNPTIDVSTSNGFSTVMKKLDVLTGDEYRAALTKYGLTSGNYGASVDAFDEITRTAYVQTHNISVGAGNEYGRYRFSVGYQNQQGILKGSDLRKLTGNFNGSFAFLPNKRLTLDFMLMAAGIQENLVPVSENAGFQGSLVAQALQWNPTHPLRQQNGTIWLVPQFGNTSVNPLAMIDAYRDQPVTNNLLASISPGFKILNGLDYKLQFSINRNTATRAAMISRNINLQNIEGRGAAALSSGELNAQQLTHTLNFYRDLSSALNLNAVVGYEYLKYDQAGFGAVGQDFPDNIDLNYANLIQYSKQDSRQIFSFKNPSSELQSYFARAIFNIYDRYIITGTFRADGSSKFGANNRYGYFPSLAAAWVLSNESFLKGTNPFNLLRLRVGYGQVGNQDFPSGASLNRLQFGQQSIFRTNFGNDDLKWETSTTSNAGIDFGIANNRLFGTIEYFNKKTTDPIFERAVAAPGPSAKVWVNLPGEIVNKGWEISLNSSILRETSLTWNLGVNASFLKNNVTGLGEYEFYETGGLHGQGISGATAQRVVNNQPINVFYLPKYIGIDKTTGQSLYEGGDPSVNKFYVGSPNPTTLLGLTTDLGYNKFTLTLNMNGALGHYLYNNTANSVTPIGNLGTRNVASSLINSDVKEDQSNPIAPSTRYMEKGDFLKLANASLNYNVGSIGRAVKNFGITLTGQNLFVITKFTGFDPEVNQDKSVGGIPSFGIEYTPYPSARSILLGLNFSLY